MKSLFALFVSFGIIAPVLLYAAMTGGSFEIYADSVGFLDSAGSTGGDFTLYGSGEPIQASSSTAGAFVLRGGFQSEEKGILSLSVNNSSLDLGTITTGAVSTGVVTTTISTDSYTGYTLYISDDGNLRNGVDDINDVADGSVTAGSEEYGFVTSGSDGSIASDTAITTSLSEIASANGTVTNRQVGVVFHAAVSGSTVETTYSHNVTFSATINP